MQNFEIATATPAAIDAEISKLHDEERRLMLALDRVRTARAPLDKEYDDRGGWTRAYFVNNIDGHVHSSVACPTLQWNTSISWLTEYSGKDQGEIIEAAGWRACTRCYPDAPIGDAKTLPSSIRSDEDVEREARNAERQEKAKQRDEKVVRDAEGGVMFKTERSAEIAAVEHLYEVYNLTVMEAEDEGHRVHLDGLRAEHAAHAKEISLALATKRDQDHAEILAGLIGKAGSKAIALAKGWNKDPRSNMDWAGKVAVPAKGEAGRIIHEHL